MDPNGRRDKTRRIVIITLSAAIAGLTTALAASYERIGMGLAVATGYIILFMSAALVNSFLHNSASDTKRMLCLVFSICVLLLFLGGMAYLLFNQNDDEPIEPEITEEIVIPEIEEEIEEETAELDEIAIPSAPQVMWTVRIDDSSPHPVSEEPSDEISLQDEKSPRDSSETTAVIDSDNASSESAALIPDDPIFIGSMIRSIEDEIPSAPVFIESSINAVEKDPVAIPDTPIFIEASIDEINENETAIVPVIIGGVDAETEIQIEEPVVEESTTETLSDSNNDFFSGLSPEEADFWADFYIAGEDELELADGIYYMDLYLNEMYTGDITVSMQNGVPYLSALELESYLTGTVTDEMILKLFHSNDEFISLDFIKSQNVGCSFDSLAYEVYLQFSLNDMPVQILSLRGTPRSGISRTLAGATVLEPAAITITSDYSFTARVNEFRTRNIENELNFYFTADNEIRLYDLNLELDYYFEFGLDWFYADVSRYRFYMDFEDIMARLSWGNISTSLLSPAGQAVGIRFETDSIYGSPDARNSHSYVEQMLVVDKRSDVQILNEGREIFRRTLAPGVYRLRDFVLYSGANRIKIIVNPLDGSESKEMEMDVMYSSSILAPGEVYFGVALATGRERVTSRRNAPGEVYIPFGDYMLRYDARNITLSAEIDAGLVESLGLSASLAVQNLPTNDASFRLNSSLALEFTHINVLGTTRYNLNVQERSDTQGVCELPSMNASIGHQISTGWTGLSSVTLGASYIAPDNWDFQRYNPLSLNLSMSGRFGIFSWGLSAYSAIPMNEPSDLSWSVSGSFGLYAGPNFSISGSIGVSDSASGPANISGRISATYRFGIGAVTATAGLDEATVSTYVRSDKHYFRADVDSNGYKSINDLGMSAGYSYSGNLFDVDLDLDTASLFRNIRASATVSTSTIFADGVFAMASSVPSNYLLVRQYGSLKGNDLFVGSAGSSATREIPSTFGTGIYTGVSTYNATNIGIFSSGDNVFGGTSSYSLNIPYSARTGYVLKLHGDNVYAASGVIILPDGTPWLNGASPLYSVDSETEALNVTEHYLFTDSDGRFTATGLTPGEYAFDVPYGNNWMLVIFTVSDTGVYDRIQIFESTEPSFAISSDETYSYFMNMTDSGSLNESEFFNMIYPEEAV